jgi:hypothetical protein
MEPATNEDADGVAAAKARLHAIIREIDPLKPMRQRPLVTILVAGTAGAMLAANTEKLVGAATFTRALTSLVGMVTGAVHKFQEQREQHENHEAEEHQEAVPQESTN